MVVIHRWDQRERERERKGLYLWQKRDRIRIGDIDGERRVLDDL